MFIIKCLIVTVALVVVFQIRVGQRTVEGHLMTWIHHSPISHTLQDVAEGAVKIGKQGQQAVSGLMGSKTPEDEAPSSSEETTASTGWFKIKRSAAYNRQQRQKKAAELKRAPADGSDGESLGDSGVESRAERN